MVGEKLLAWRQTKKRVYTLAPIRPYLAEALTHMYIRHPRLKFWDIFFISAGVSAAILHFFR